MTDFIKKPKYLKKYVRPTLKTHMLICENTIAAGSASVTPLNENSIVRHEWETGPEIVFEQSW